MPSKSRAKQGHQQRQQLAATVNAVVIPTTVFHNNPSMQYPQQQHKQQLQQVQHFLSQAQFLHALRPGTQQQQMFAHPQPQVVYFHPQQFNNIAPQQQAVYCYPNHAYQWNNLAWMQQQRILYMNQFQQQACESLQQPQQQKQQATHSNLIKNDEKNPTELLDSNESIEDSKLSNGDTSSLSMNKEEQQLKNGWRKVEIQQDEDDTVQRNSSKAGHNNSNSNPHHSHHHRKSRKDHQHQSQQVLMKNDSSDSRTSINGQNAQQQQQQQHNQQQNNRINTKHLKSRYGKQQQQQQQQQRHDGQHSHHHQQRSPQKRGFSMDDWLENGDAVYYERRRFISSSDEDKLGRRHNTAHRNSTSSETAPSEDLTTSSSNEDLREDSYDVSPKCKKTISKSRQRRQQQKRKKQLSESGNSNQDENDDAMDVDLSGTKENCRPSNGGHGHGKTLRQECIKNAAHKAATGFNGNCGSNNNSSSNNSTNNGSNTSKHGKAGNVLKNSNSITNTKRAASTGLGSNSGNSSSSGLSSSSSLSSSPSSSSTESSPTASPTSSKRNAEHIKKIALQLAPPLRTHAQLNFSEKQLIQHLQRYLIDQNLLRVYGYPVESAIHEGCIEVYKCLPKPNNAPMHHHHHQQHNHHNSQQNHQQQHLPQQHQQHTTQRFAAYTSIINANDGLHVSTVTSYKRDEYTEQLCSTADDAANSTDSGQGSGDSSPPSMDSDTSEGAEDEPSGTTALYTPDGSYQIFSQYDQSLEKQCVRCNSTFHVTETGEYLNRESCTFHWGKLNQIYAGDKGYCYQYTCCQGDHESQGCMFNELHVWTGAVVGLNGPYTDFVHTKPRYDSDGPSKAYAMDCEMSFTGRGLEVTKVTVVGYDGRLAYEHFVRPDAEIVDYNTRFSGITENDLCPNNSNNSVKTLTEVQRDLLRLFDADTILIGHGLDNDLRALRIVHKTIIDTSISFPHASGFPYRRALKHLTKVYLNRDIQTSDAGHSSFEDSRACLELMLWKVRKEMRYH